MNEKFSLNDFIEEAWSHADRDGEVTQEFLMGFLAGVTAVHKGGDAVIDEVRDSLCYLIKKGEFRS